MAEESKFLKWQDTNGDMLPDVCPDDIPARVNACLPCSPNPLASVPDWKTKNQSSPFLNEKLCIYQISYLTKEKSLGYFSNITKKDADERLNKIWDHYADEWETDVYGTLPSNWLSTVAHRKNEPRKGAIRALLDWKGKDKSDDSIQKIKDALEKTEYYLAPNPGSYVQLLYSVDYSVLEELPDAPPENTAEEAEEGDKTIKYTSADLVLNQIKVRKGIHLWSRYLKVFRALENSNLIFADTGKVFNLEDYGDAGPFDMYGQVSVVQQELDSWLNQQGVNLPNTGTWGLTSQNIEEIEITVTGEYKLKKIQVWTDLCNEVPIKYGKDRVESLATMPGWRDPTAVAYFMQLDEIAGKLSARTEQPWLEMVLEYTYPKLMVRGPGAGQVMPGGQIDGQAEDSATLDAISCVANSLVDEGKQLGQNIMDDLFGLGDAMAAKFHASLCRHSEEEIKEDLEKQGQKQGASDVPEGYPKEGTGKPNEAGTKKTTFSDMKNAAFVQAYKEIDPRDQVFAQLCFRILNGRDGPISIGDMMDDVYAYNLERIKVCGMFDLLVSAIECLTQGMTLDKALSIMLMNALKAMTYDDFGKLFVGLPPDKQAKLDALVQKNLKDGKMLEGAVNPYTEIAGPGTTTQKEGFYATGSVKNDSFFGSISFTKPWEDPELVKTNNQRAKDNGLGQKVNIGQSPMETALDRQKTATKRTIAQRLDPAAAAKKDGLDETKIFEAYILALLEEYSDNYLALLDKLNDFPGAQIISFLIATYDCPRPPLFNPGLDDFVKSITLPFCRNNAEITIPRLDWPAWWWPLIMDPWKTLFDFLKEELMKLVYKWLKMILAKVCELVGSAICKALEITGQLIVSIPGQIAGTTTITDVIRDSICGAEADQEQVEATVVQLIADLGVGGQALSNPERALMFAEDLSAAATAAEMTSAIMGDPSETFLQIADQIVENGYPEYRDALPNMRSVGSFFKNVGFLVPAAARQEMSIALEALGASANNTPANPSLCATPEQMENFKELRCSLLEGRATPEQCETMFNNWRGDMMDDLDSVSDLLQKGIGPSILEAMPPLLSDPGCNNGIMPYEPEETIASAQAALGGELKKIEQAYAQDMLGSGGFLGFLAGGVDSSWGFLNMVLSDTVGNPFTRHQVDSTRDPNYVDFYLDTPGDLGGAISDFVLGSPTDLIPPFTNIFALGSMLQGGGGQLQNQEGAYPQYVAEWLMYQYRTAAGQGVDSRLKLEGIKEDLKQSMGFSSTNIPRRTKKWPVSFATLGFDSLFGTSDVELTDIPDMGYNVRTAPDWDEENLWFIKMPRKDEPDIALDFKDNTTGLRLGLNGGQRSWSYMFRVNAYFSDMIEAPQAGSYVNRPDDNVRIYLTEFFNQASPSTSSQLKDMDKAANPNAPSVPELNLEENIIRSRKYEFIGVDNGLDSLYDPDPDKGEYLSMADFPNLSESFSRQSPFAPQINMLYDLFDGALSKSQIKQKYDSFMSDQFIKVAKELGNNTKGWEYGMTFDDLDITDFDYLAPTGTSLADGTKVPKPSDSKAGLLFSEIEITDYDSDGEPDGSRILSEEDMVLGVSRNQWINERAGTHPEKTRVFFLNPTEYGGSYIQPPIYVKPRKSFGWAGIVEVMFPELSPCETMQTNAVDFDEIANKISEIYPNIPEDSRIKGDPDCVVERPYNRILHRQSAASIEGIITAAIRIYSSIHFLKGLPMFTKFAPKFPDNYSNIYSSYIVETMEKDFRDATDLYSPFSDSEFWFAFLEQSVQTYGRRVDSGDIKEENVPVHVREALERLNDYQSDFHYPFTDDLFVAKYSGEAGIFETLKSFRESSNLEAIYRTQEDAKLVLKELVNEQLGYMGNKFTKAMESFDMAPDIHDLDYYYMTDFTAGTEELGLTLDGTIVEGIVGLPTEEEPDPAGLGWSWPGPFYTNGNEFALPDGSTYVGYYHAHTDEQDGSLEYMVGEHHTGGGETLRPFANKIIVGIEKVIDRNVPDADTGKKTYETIFTPLGDVPDGDAALGSDDKLFYMYKYIKVNGDKKSNNHGVYEVKSAGSGPISLSFPGTLEIVTNDDGKEVGTKGELGVRYGLEFGMKHGSANHPISNIEIDALDVPVSAFSGIEANSKILYCLLAKLKEDQKFKLVTNYAFSFKKVLSIMAIYQDMGFMPSIGEVTAEEGALFGDIFHDAGSWNPGDPKAKPGTYAELKKGSVEVERENWLGITSTEEVETIEGAQLKYTPGWAAVGDRGKNKAAFFSHMNWDHWDKIPLRHSAAAIKRLFRVHYRSRDFGGADEELGNLSKEFVMQMKERFKLDPSKAILPWWQTRRLRSNPFNEEGELCKKKD